MTRDHDMKRAIRARMRATGEPYTVARAALAAPSLPATRGPETHDPLGGTMASVHNALLNELDEHGFAVLRSFATADQVAHLTEVVDEVIASAAAQKLEEGRRRLALGERGFSVGGEIFTVVSGRREVRWDLRDRRLLDIAEAVRGAGATLRKVGAIASLPGFGHQGLHQDSDGVDAAIGSWDRLVFVVMLSSRRAGAGALRALPGSHRTPQPPFPDSLGSAMAPHDDEVHVECEPGDVLVYSGHLWKSGTFNAGREPVKSLLVAGTDDVGW